MFPKNSVLKTLKEHLVIKT